MHAYERYNWDHDQTIVPKPPRRGQEGYKLLESGTGLCEDDIRVGKHYRGKRFLGGTTYNNDRSIVWISSNRDKVQYDSDTVKTGRLRPRVTMAQFLNWVKRELTPEEVAAYFGHGTCATSKP